MKECKKQIIIQLVHTFAKKANITNQEEIIYTINRLCSMEINDAIDAILVLLNDLLNRKMITKEDIFSNVDSIISLNPEKYKSVSKLIERLNWIKELNMEHHSMSLTENHQLVMEVFDRFNELLNGNFDCYYTGGFMGYLATGQELKRYHGDLDLFINEQQLVILKDLIDSNQDFDFVSNMGHKEVNGHEYKIVYKDTPMSIGLFLFERQQDNSITTKEYYFENQNINGQLLVDEHHFSKKYTEMSFSNQIREHNGIPYKMMSLESIYNSKKNSRPKDRYDAQIIKDNVDITIDNKLDLERKNNFDINRKQVTKSIIQTIEQLLQKKDISYNEKLIEGKKFNEELLNGYCK